LILSANIVKFYWFLYQLLRFWYYDDPNRNIVHSHFKCKLNFTKTDDVLAKDVKTDVAHSLK